MKSAIFVLHVFWRSIFDKLSSYFLHAFRVL